MKCHKCLSDNNLRDRTNGRCPRCSHQIVFDPRRTNDPFNDIQFSKTLELISPGGTIKFNDMQFYYFLNSRRIGKFEFLGCLSFIFLPLMVFLLFVGTSQKAPAILSLLFTLFSLYLVIVLFTVLNNQKDKFRHRIKWPYKMVKDSLSRWESANGLLGALLPEPSKSIPATADVPKEILDYSFDRLIVTQSDDIAQFLIANNFHFENNCAVLSINQYPYTLFDIVMKMLRNNENLKVYTLHDASWKGLCMLDKLKNEKIWFAEQPSAQIIDLGLVPRQFEKRKAFIEKSYESQSASELSDSVKNSLSATEIKWLDEGNVVRVESIAPRALLRLITAGIATSRDPDKKDALVPVDSGSGDTGGIYVFTGDSFG